MTQSAAPAAGTDEALVFAFGRGDEFLYSSGADRDDIEDLVQETLFRAFRRPSRSTSTRFPTGPTRTPT